MNRDEMLTNLAMELAEWPSSSTRMQVIGGDFYPTAICACNSFSEQDYLQRRAELINKPSWDDAPEWAEGLFQDRDGVWHWCNAPDMWDTDHGLDVWVCSANPIREMKSNTGAIPDGHDWRNTLESRPTIRLGDEPGASTTACDDQFLSDPERPLASRELGGDDASMLKPKEWDGEGVPPEGSHVWCRNASGTRYTRCEVVFSSDYWVVVEALEGEAGESAQDAIDVLDYHSFSRLRSVLTHEGRAVEAMIKAYRDAVADKTWQEGIRGLYTAILEGRIPGVKLEV